MLQRGNRSSGGRPGVGGKDASIDRFGEALAAADRPRDRATILCELGGICIERLELERAMRLAEQGLAEIGSARPALDHACSEPRDPLARGLLAVWLRAGSLHRSLEPVVRARARALLGAAVGGEPPLDPELQAFSAFALARAAGAAAQARTLAGRALAIPPGPGDAAAGRVGLALATLHRLDHLAAAQRSAESVLATAQRTGAEAVAATARCWRALILIERGALAEAAAEAQRALALSERDWALTAELAAAALARARLELGEPEAAAAALASVRRDGEHAGAAVLEARARVRLADGEADRALADLRAARERQGPDLATGTRSWRLLAAEAARRLGRTAAARELTGAELELARASGVGSALGNALVGHGTLTPGPDGVAMLAEAVAILERSESRLGLARALVELGAALRRNGSRTAARKPLRRGLELGASFGAAPLVERARAELWAAGGRPRRFAISGVGALTATELRVAELAARGLGNVEIAAELVVARKTVEWHLGNCYRKLEIHSRAELAGALAAARAGPPTAPGEPVEPTSSAVTV